MHCIQYIPHPALALYVHSGWEIRYDLPVDVTLAVPFSCTGHSHFVFCLESPFQGIKQGRPMELCESILFAQNDLPYTKYFSGPTLGVSIDFTPTGLQTLWQLPVHELSGQSMDLTAILSKDLQGLTNQLREARSTAQRFRLLDTFLLQRLARADRAKFLYTDGRIEAAVNAIQRYPGQVNLQRLAYQLNTAERTLRRRFTQVVGVSSKYYIRMQRFIHVRHWLSQQVRPDWQQILTRTGYFDQAHLINEFSYFSGSSPLLYQRTGGSTHDFFFD